MVISLTARDIGSNPHNAPSDEEKVCLSVLCVNTDYSRNFSRAIRTQFPELEL